MRNVSDLSRLVPLKSVIHSLKRMSRALSEWDRRIHAKPEGRLCGRESGSKPRLFTVRNRSARGHLIFPRLAVPYLES